MGLTNLRYAVSNPISTQPAADSLRSWSAAEVISLPPNPAAGATCRLPGRGRRRDPPGEPQPRAEWRATLAGYPPAATPGNRELDGAADGAPCSALRRRRRCVPPRIRPEPAHCYLALPAGGRTEGSDQSCYRSGSPLRSRLDAASARLRAASRRRSLGARRQRLTRARPFRRRAARIARPARVRIRSRKPCVFARCRLFGWNVRLLTETPDKSRSKGR
jgi:hypothetical protein